MGVVGDEAGIIVVDCGLFFEEAEGEEGFGDEEYEDDENGEGPKFEAADLGVEGMGEGGEGEVFADVVAVFEPIEVGGGEGGGIEFGFVDVDGEVDGLRDGGGRELEFVEAGGVGVFVVEEVLVAAKFGLEGLPRFIGGEQGGGLDGEGGGAGPEEDLAGVEVAGL